jgi:hypothetical protein
MTRPTPQRSDGPPCWVVVILGDCGRYATISTHASRGEAAAAAEQHAGSVILFRPAPVPAEEF